MAPKTEKTIFHYTDYRLYLKEYYQIRKKANKNFSYRSFAMKAGVSPSVLKDVISGRRNLTIPIMKKYSKAMKLGKKELDYFDVLVRFNNSNNNDEKNQCFTEMIRARGHSGIKFIGEDHYTFFSKWYNSAIRELVTLPAFKEDYSWISKQLQPSIPVSEVKSSIDLLLSIGFLKRDKKGKLIQSDAVISSEYEMASAALRNFHAQMIELAGKSLEEIHRSQREVSSLTLGISEKTLVRMKERIRIFKEELLSMVVDDKSDSETVCQLNFQLFPLVKSLKEDEK